MKMTEIVGFKNLLDVFAREIHENALYHGFWEGAYKDSNVGEKIALMHSELSEALEAYRKDNPPDEHCEQYNNMEIELADCIIRILDFSVAHSLDISGAMIAKAKFNKGRPFKHNKKI